ncbi:toxin-antitoxin system YwqK family antitoxin [Chitinophaga caeni]|nr:hypothetical protein [Chitinophaga caeni]
MLKVFQCCCYVLLCCSVFGQNKINQSDAQGRKQGYWVVEMPALRGERAYTMEGTYKDGKKDGPWKKFNHAGDIISMESFRNDKLHGPVKYYYPNGQLSLEGSYLAQEIRRDSARVYDIATDENKMQAVEFDGQSVKNGWWKMYDERGHLLSQEYYKKGELIKVPTFTDSTDSTDSTDAKNTQDNHSPKK